MIDNIDIISARFPKTTSNFKIKTARLLVEIVTITAYAARESYTKNTH